MPAVYPLALADGPAESIGTRTVADPYRTLEDTAAARQWCADQHAYARSVLDHLPGRAAAAGWIHALFHTGRRSVPTARPGAYFYLRLLPDEPEASLVRYDLRTGAERVVAAPAAAARLTAWQVSACGQWLAYQVSRAGVETGPLFLRDLQGGARDRVAIAQTRRPALSWLTRGGATQGVLTGGVMPDVRTGGAPPADAGQSLLFAAARDGEPAAIWTPEHRPGPSFVTPLASPDGRFALASVRYGANLANDLWLLELAADPADPPVHAEALTRGAAAATLARFGPDGAIYLVSDDRDGALARIDPGRPEPAAWEWLSPGVPDSSSRGLAVSASRIALLRSTGAGPSLSLLARDGTAVPVRLPSPVGTVTALTADPAGPAIWYEYSDVVRPPSVYRVDPTGITAPEPMGGPGPAADVAVRSHRETVLAADRTPLVLTIFDRADRPAGPTSCVLSVYGGFGRPATAGYRPDMLLWVLSGGVYAVAQLRGGGDRGPRWHAAGRRNGKSVTVRDAIAVAGALAERGWTTPDRLAITGNSNGGLIAAAAAVLRPELFAACVALSPVTDLVRFPLLGDGAAWLGEYGDPRRLADLTALLSVSPYHNVRPGVPYPAFLVSTGTNDARVPPGHARKLVAALQAATASPAARRPVLLREDPGRGHAPGSSPERVAYAVDQTVFLWAQLGLPTIPLPPREDRRP